MNLIQLANPALSGPIRLKLNFLGKKEVHIYGQ